MHSRDWSLVFLTVLSQAGIGIVLCFTGLLYFAGGAAPAMAGFSAVSPLLLALLLVVVATAASFLHLGNPSNAPRALRNLAGSWLSREILAIGAFTLLLAAALVSFRVGGESGVFRLLLLLASVAGLFLLWAMTRVYMIATIPAWNSWYTPVSFTATALSLGLTGSLLLMDIGQPVNSYFVGSLGVILALELLTGLLNQRRLTGMDTGFDGPVYDRGAFYWLFLARTAILLAVCLALLFTGAGTAWVYPVFALVIIQEFAGRQMFYASYFRVGV